MRHGARFCNCHNRQALAAKDGEIEELKKKLAAMEQGQVEAEASQKALTNALNQLHREHAACPGEIAALRKQIQDTKEALEQDDATLELTKAHATKLDLEIRSQRQRVKLGAGAPALEGASNKGGEGGGGAGLPPQLPLPREARDLGDEELYVGTVMGIAQLRSQVAELTQAHEPCAGMVASLRAQLEEAHGKQTPEAGWGGLGEEQTAGLRQELGDLRLCVAQLSGKLAQSEDMCGQILRQPPFGGESGDGAGGGGGGQGESMTPRTRAVLSTRSTVGLMITGVRIEHLLAQVSRAHGLCLLTLTTRALPAQHAPRDTRASLLLTLSPCLTLSLSPSPCLTLSLSPSPCLTLSLSPSPTCVRIEHLLTRTPPPPSSSRWHLARMVY